MTKLSEVEKIKAHFDLHNVPSAVVVNEQLVRVHLHNRVFTVRTIEYARNLTKSIVREKVTQRAS